MKDRLTNDAGETLATFHLTPTTLSDEVRAGGRIPLIIGRSLTDKARQALEFSRLSEAFIRPVVPQRY